MSALQLEAAATVLGPLVDEVVFVGGATIHLWASPPRASPPRRSPRFLTALGQHAHRFQPIPAADFGTG
jgi:hypothetical protein